MDDHYWHANQHYIHQHLQPVSSPEPAFNRVAADSVHGAHRLLAVYPMASATPTTHVARHINNLAVTANTPTYMQASYNNFHYPSHNAVVPQMNEYSHEISRLSAMPMPAQPTGYWERSRDQCMQVLGDPDPSTSYSFPSQWSRSQGVQSGYQTPALASSIFQRMTPASAYPTPPPPSVTPSTSSLAFALGYPPETPQNVSHRFEDSSSFFNSFLEQQSQGLAQAFSGPNDHQMRTPSRHVHTLPHESPDPLALTSNSNCSAPSITPRKRKSTERVSTPSHKRLHAAHSDSTVISRVSAMTGSSSSSSSSKTPRRTLAYVEVPPLPKMWFTPSPLKTHSFRQGKTDSPDLGGYGSEDDDTHVSKTAGLTSVKSSARRTGDRDDRDPLEKFIALTDDIFDAEDSLPADVDRNPLSKEYFTSIGHDRDQPLLQPNIIRKLTKYIIQMAKPVKRTRRTTRENGLGGGTPKGKASLANVDSGVISRLLKILDRSVVAGENVEPFSTIPQAGAKNDSPRKGRKILKTRKTLTGVEEKISTSGSGDISQESTMVEEAAMAVEDSSTSSVLTNVDLEQLSKHLDVARDSVLAADCCIALLGSDRLIKQLYSEELIMACLSTIKNQLTSIVYPFVEASTIDRPNSALLKHLHKGSDASSIAHRRQLSELFQALSVALPHINRLISEEAVVMSDAIIIHTVYIAIGPFFVFEPGGDSDGKGKKENVVLSTLGNSSMRGLRLDALSLIRGVFARHESQRSWIIEEILTSLIKLSDGNKKAGQFRLRDGRSIKTVSALLLQLVQTSAHDIRIEASQIAKNRQRRFALRRQENINDRQAEPFLDELDLEEVRLYVGGLESASKAAKTIVIFLTQRSGKSKSTKSSNEAEYRAILDNLISDLLTVLYWPEWPAASLLLSVVCKFMVSSLDDVKSSQTDNNAAKNIALDHLGTIAARMRSSSLKVKQRQAGENVLPMEEIISTANSEEFRKLILRHQDIAMHLCKRSSDDQAYDSARELTAATWGQELALALNQVHNFLENPENETTQKHRDMLLFGGDLRNALRDVWKDNTVDVFDIGSQEEIVRIDQLAEEIGTIQSLKNTFGPILNVVLLALDAPQVFMRTKALRALGQIVTSDPSILSAANVRGAIEGHLLDSSPAVRDAAVELIGKYLVDSPAVAGDYYQRIADRIADTGLGVRKRVIRLLKSYYQVTDNMTRRVDISTKLVLRMLDEDNTVKDLAVKTLEELWFTITSLHGLSMKVRQSTKPTNGDKGGLLSNVSVIMGVATNFKDRQSPLEDLLRKMIADKDGTDLTSLRGSYTEICETLIDGLVDASDLPGFTVHTCIRTIFLFTTAYPPVLSGSNASTLLPYLKPATSPEEVIITDYLLKIFRASVPHMPRTSVKLGQELQLLLQPMILKPSTIGGVQGLQESVACMCAVVQNLTHDFNRLVALVKSCNARLQQAICRSTAQRMTPVEVRTLSILIFIVSLLGEHCDFDYVRNEYEDLASDLNTITRGSVVEHIYNSLLKLYEKYDDIGLQGRILQCLGFLFRAQPTLMTLESSAKIMDDTFKSSDEDSHGRLLRIMQDFLTAESVKQSIQSKVVNLKTHSSESEVNMEELVGNTDGFADSGVSSAIVQRYIASILDAALSQNAAIQAVAIDILSFTVKQGLAHPLQSFPIIIALETSPISAISARANALHAVLYSKHTSLLNVRYVVSARESFNYQKRIGTGVFKGYRLQSEPVALLQRWYSLVREKRGSRQDFLRSLVKVFDINGALQSSQDDIDFARYMAENFSAFDYKTQEEVLTVINYLTSVLSTAGMQLIEVLSPSNLLTQLHDASQTEAVEAVENPHVSAKLGASAVQRWDIAVIRSSVIVGMVMLLKAYLKMLYGLSEEKCIKFAPGKKSIVGDKAVTKRHHNPIMWDRLPFASTPLVDQDIENHRTMFLAIWSEDGVTVEPDDDST
ncbi:hypothetical protein SERLA73DRAFT_109431 [Serpula lacrymans var. lacrymans S7.3]|uniref:Sister chromatid cohesion protein n=1 Tax=Serpula lacrymans var. lacrymans (strain S7.3) TaxID=936435 RepID=F8Q1C2_SERL3|nr:hypothetical protein SERLA73DRAFT_109431 [Serpula lacrymans var. lacrymans S7.3]